jgi:hypothetical protein
MTSAQKLSKVVILSLGDMVWSPVRRLVHVHLPGHQQAAIHHDLILGQSLTHHPERPLGSMTTGTPSRSTVTLSRVNRRSGLLPLARFLKDAKGDIEQNNAARTITSPLTYAGQDYHDRKDPLVIDRKFSQNGTERPAGA